MVQAPCGGRHMTPRFWCAGAVAVDVAVAATGRGGVPGARARRGGRQPHGGAHGPGPPGAQPTPGEAHEAPGLLSGFASRACGAALGFRACLALSDKHVKVHLTGTTRHYNAALSIETCSEVF